MLIAIDHGNKQIKTVHATPFTSGLIQSDALGFGTDYLAYQGKYYALTDQRIPYRRDKTEDERFFILTVCVGEFVMLKPVSFSNILSSSKSASYSASVRDGAFRL